MVLRAPTEVRGGPNPADVPLADRLKPVDGVPFEPVPIELLRKYIGCVPFQRDEFFLEFSVVSVNS
jgi:hypothetical protein